MKLLTLFTLAVLSFISLSLQAGEREAEAWKLIDKGAVVIDVRTTEEYARGHLQNALHIPFQQIAAQLQSLELRKDREVVLYCRSGRRASVAETALIKAGYSRIYNGGGLVPLVEQRRSAQ